MCYLRRDIYEHILMEQNEPFTIQLFRTKHKIKNDSLVDKLVNQITLELEQLGWNVKRTFQGALLFVYDPKNPPDRLNWYSETIESEF